MEWNRVPARSQGRRDSHRCQDPRRSGLFRRADFGPAVPAHELGTSLSLDETLSVLSLRLKRMCAYDCIAIYLLRDNVLVPEYVSGENFHLFSSLRITIGEGLSGWVAENKRPIVNGNPSVEPGYLNDPNRFSTLQSALAVPLEGLNGVGSLR